MSKPKKEIVPPILPPEFEAAMRKIATAPKEAVDKVIAANKKAKKGKKR